MAVALRKESVDRNRMSRSDYDDLCLSLSARRAWIEIKHLLKLTKDGGCRSPQGERG